MDVKTGMSHSGRT